MTNVQRTKPIEVRAGRQYRTADGRIATIVAEHARHVYRGRVEGVPSMRYWMGDGFHLRSPELVLIEDVGEAPPLPPKPEPKEPRAKRGDWMRDRGTEHAAAMGRAGGFARHNVPKLEVGGEYRTADGRKAVIVGIRSDTADRPIMGYIVGGKPTTWKRNGSHTKHGWRIVAPWSSPDRGKVYVVIRMKDSQLQPLAFFTKAEADAASPGALAVVEADWQA